MEFIALVTLMIVGFIVYCDAESRGMSGIIWALLVVLFMIVFLPLYCIVRKDKVKV